MKRATTTSPSLRERLDVQLVALIAAALTSRPNRLIWTAVVASTLWWFAGMTVAVGAGGAARALAQVPEGCGKQPNTAPALQPPQLLTDWAWLVS